MHCPDSSTGLSLNMHLCVGSEGGRVEGRGRQGDGGLRGVSKEEWIF